MPATFSCQLSRAVRMSTGIPRPEARHFRSTGLTIHAGEHPARGRIPERRAFALEVGQEERDGGRGFDRSGEGRHFGGGLVEETADLIRWSCNMVEQNGDFNHSGGFTDGMSGPSHLQPGVAGRPRMYEVIA